MSYSSYFRKLRKDRKLSQQELADILGVSSSQISNIENGRSKGIRQDMMNALVEFVGKDPLDIAYDIFFRYEPVDSVHRISEINRRYLSSLWNKDRVISFTQKFDTKDNAEIIFDGVFWKDSKPYNRILLGNFHKKKYLSAISKKDKISELRKTILLDTLILENLADLENIVEFRFVLDSEDPDDVLIFNEIKNISFINLGKNIEISYLLFDRKKENNNSKQDIHYVTDRRSALEI